MASMRSMVFFIMYFARGKTAPTAKLSESISFAEVPLLNSLRLKEQGFCYDSRLLFLTIRVFLMMTVPRSLALTALPVLLLLWTFALANELVGISPAELRKMASEGVTVVDIRTPMEWQKTGLIPGSVPLTYFDAQGHSDPKAFIASLEKITGGKSAPVILVCRSGHRSGEAGKLLAGSMGFSAVYHLEKGITGWMADGGPVKLAAGAP